MDRNAEMNWYLDQFSGSRERFYEIHMQMCRKFGISWSKASSKERQFIGTQTVWSVRGASHIAHVGQVCI